ncbi:MAG: DUF4188 domain-containing protein [Myxococcales bacterium]|nr:DUF4188 domain-containing protein [Myxococcales bacterium]
MQEQTEGSETKGRKQQRMTADHHGGVVVFLIGMRVNRWRDVRRWLPVARAMPRMIEELQDKPDSGFLGFEPAGFGTMIQYWESKEKLLAYAKDQSGEHFPAWADFYRRSAEGGAVGIWHETFVVEPGAYESVYYAMPPRGLGRIAGLIPALGRLQGAAGRMARGKPSVEDEQAA